MTEREAYNCQQAKKAKQIMLKSAVLYDLHEVYLDYFNNFLSVEAFAEYYGFSYPFAVALIKEMKEQEQDQ